MTKRLHASLLTLLFFRIGIVLCVAPIFALTLYGQAFYGSVVGTIADQSAAALSGVTVTLTNVGTGEVHKTQPGAGGDYRFLKLVPRLYRVEVEQGGLKKATRDNVEVTVSGTVRADISMQPGEVTQTLEVQATAPLLQTEDARLSQVVNTPSAEELPVNGRNIVNPTALVPGVVAQGTTSGDAITGNNIFAAGNYQIGGGLANQGATYYDCIPPNSALGNLVKMAPSPDSVSEFRVQAGLAIAIDETARADVNLKAGTVGATVEVAAQAAQIHGDSSAVTNATSAQVINNVLNVTQNPLFYAMLRKVSSRAARGPPAL